MQIAAFANQRAVYRRLVRSDALILFLQRSDVLELVHAFIFAAAAAAAATVSSPVTPAPAQSAAAAAAKPLIEKQGNAIGSISKSNSNIKINSGLGDVGSMPPPPCQRDRWAVGGGGGH